MTVRSAATMSDPATGMALLRFEVAPAFDDLPDWNRCRTDLAAALDGRLALAAAARGTGAALRPPPAGLGAGPPGRAGHHRQLGLGHVHRGRGPGARTGAPSSTRWPRPWPTAALTITCALINTLGAEVIDVFYVQTVAGDQVVDPDSQQQLAGGRRRSRPLRLATCGSCAGSLVVQPGVLAPQPHGDGEPADRR